MLTFSGLQAYYIPVHVLQCYFAITPPPTFLGLPETIKADVTPREKRRGGAKSPLGLLDSKIYDIPISMNELN